MEHVHSTDGPAPQPPRGPVRLVHYPSPVGDLPAYLAEVPGAGRHAAIVWIQGGDYHSIGDVWSPRPPANDQSAAAFRQAGIVTLYPTLRGGNDDSHDQEAFFGEADDIVAAADYLAGLPSVDPHRIYLGGHSTGGTMVLLEAEYTDRFRAVFSFGPVTSPDRYDPSTIAWPVPDDPRELRLRSPIAWLSSIRTPTFVLEGADQPSNAAEVSLLEQANRSDQAHFATVQGFDHFSVLAPVNQLLAEKVAADTGSSCSITLTEQELSRVGRG